VSRFEQKLLYADHTCMVYGDTQDVVSGLMAGVKKV
jgi:NAD/NADP transhydrogenase beta subunit